MIITVLIVPTETEMGTQCRVVAADGLFRDPLSAYRHDHSAWGEVGLVNSRGELVCIEPEFAAMKQDEPLMAGVYYVFDDAGAIV